MIEIRGGFGNKLLGAVEVENLRKTHKQNQNDMDMIDDAMKQFQIIQNQIMDSVVTKERGKMIKHNYNMLCIREHGRFLKGQVYKCDYEKICDTQYYKIFYTEGSRHDYYYGEKAKTYCNLNHFVKVNVTFLLKVYKRSKILTFINKIFNTSLNEEYKSYKKFNYQKLNKGMFGEVYLKILTPITSTFESEFYTYHQEKFDYILSSILRINEMSEHINVTERLEKYEKLIQDVLESIKTQNERVEQELLDNMNPIIENYLDKEDRLFSDWEGGLNEIWK